MASIVTCNGVRYKLEGAPVLRWEAGDSGTVKLKMESGVRMRGQPSLRTPAFDHR